MEYKLKIGEETFDLEINKTDDGSYETSIGDDTNTLSVHAVNPNLLYLKTNGRAVPISVAPAVDGLWVWANGRARLVQDASKAVRRGGKGLDNGPTEVTPITPSNVVSVMVAVGDDVEKGQGLVVVSAMKMETTLTAPYSGKVTAVNTEEGAKASPGDILVEIEPSEEETEEPADE